MGEENTAAAAAQGAKLRFRCNICGAANGADRESLGREMASCRECGSSVRFRAVIHVLSVELFGRSLALPDFPERPDIKGIGMSDWEGYAGPLARKLGYRNTYYHQEPLLDITRVDPALRGSFDFVISSEVFEHVPPPVSVAFDNLCRLLKPGGVAIFTVPYGKAARTVEHFPDLHDYRIERAGERYVLKNTAADGREQVFDNLVFHGGPGTTLEMRQFSEAALLAHFGEAGFSAVTIHRESRPEFGIVWDADWSLPLSARAPGPRDQESRGQATAPANGTRRPAPAEKESDGPDANGGASNLTWEELSAAVQQYAADESHRDDVAQLLARLVLPYAYPPHYARFFRLWEESGFHLTPVHFYSAIPDTRTLGEELWRTPSALPGIDMNDAGQLDLLTNIFPRFRDEYDQFPAEPPGLPYAYYFNNSFFSGTDALVLYCMVRHFRPRMVLEVGSGFSSRVSAEAALRNAGTELVCIEPYPQDVLRQGFPGLTSLIPKKVQEVELSVFESLRAGDILFIDSSHVVKVGGDVNYLFLEVLPRLKPGVIVHVHDIYLPLVGRRDWVMKEFRFWNEQDLLQAFLVFNSEFEVLFCNSYVERRHPQAFRGTFSKSPWWGGGSFWMRRKAQ